MPLASVSFVRVTSDWGKPFIRFLKRLKVFPNYFLKLHDDLAEWLLTWRFHLAKKLDRQDPISLEGWRLHSPRLWPVDAILPPLPTSLMTGWNRHPWSAISRQIGVISFLEWIRLEKVESWTRRFLMSQTSANVSCSFCRSDYDGNDAMEQIPQLLTPGSTWVLRYYRSVAGLPTLRNIFATAQNRTRRQHTGTHFCVFFYATELLPIATGLLPIARSTD